MKIGLSSACIYPKPTEIAVEQVLKQGSKIIEIFLCSPSETDVLFIRDLKAKCDEYDAKVVAIHPWSSAFEPLFFFSGYDRRIFDGIELYKKYFEAANILGAGHIVFHGDRKDKISPNERYFNSFSKLAMAAKSHGVYLAQENVGYCKSGSLEFIREMRQNLPDTKFVLDIKQCRRANVNPSDMAEAMGKNIVELHLSDHDDKNTCMLPGKGGFDFFDFFAKLKEQGIDDIPALLELYRDNYQNECDLSEAVSYLNNKL